MSVFRSFETLVLRTLAVSVCVSVAFVVAGLASGVNEAGAAVGHPFLSSVSEGPDGGVLAGTSAVAVDRMTGLVFVADPGYGMVDVYDQSGEFVTQFGEGVIDASGIAVDEASGSVFVADSFLDGLFVFRAGGSGGYALAGLWTGEDVAGKEFGDVKGVAVDNAGAGSPLAGDVFVLDGRSTVSEEGAVDVFAPLSGDADEGGEGSLVRVLSAGDMQEPNGLAVDDHSGRVLVADSARGAIYAYDGESGELEEKLNGKGSPYGPFVREALGAGDAVGVAVDEASGDVYVAEAERHAVSEYGASGEWQGWIAETPAGSLGEPRGVAVTGAGEVLVADAGLGMVDRFATDVSVPDVITGKVVRSRLSRTGAVVTGTVDGEGKPVGYRVQYGETAGLGSETGAQTAGDGEEQVSVSLSGLRAGATYYYRLVGEGEAGSNVGVIREFATPDAVEGVSTGPIQDLRPESATVTGSLTPGGVDAHYRFQWGVTRSYGHEDPAAPGTDAGSGIEPVAATANLQGLAVNTTYHYRILAGNSYGTTYGEDHTFTTSGPPRVADEPATGISHDQATVGARIDPDELAAAYHLQYGETTSYGSEAAGGDLGPGSSPETVYGTLSGLRMGVTYHYRYVAENEAGTTYGEDRTFTTLAPATIDATSATDVGAGGATLHALANPLGHDTHVYFQYGTEECKTSPTACASIPTPPGQDIGAGEADHETIQAVSGLQADTTYYYRVLASNELGTSEGPVQTFTTAPEPLPDHRAWEMVTPPDKGGAPVEALTREGGIILAAEDGDSLAYVVDGPLGQEAQGNRSPEMQQVLATRTASGWTSQDIDTPNTKAQGVSPAHPPEYQYFTPDLSTALVEPAGVEPPLAPGVNQATPYLRENNTGAYLPLVTEANTAPGTTFGGQIHFASASQDLSHVVIDSGVALTGPSSAPGLYEWSAGRLTLVSVRPNGRPATGPVELGDSNTVARAVSSDGSRIIWTAVEEEPHLGHLYVHDSMSGTTLRLDAAQGVAEPRGAGSARFQSASSDGSRVFFTDRQRLTSDSTAEGSQGIGQPDLYECRISEAEGKPMCDLEDLTVDHNEDEHADVQGSVLATSEDGSTLYLVAQGVLASNENGNGEKAISEGDNLYELHEADGAWTTTFIATLSREDSPEWEANALANTAYVTARVSPNGRYFAFMSAASITGYDNVDAAPSADGARDEEVYLYDSLTATLRCVSCDPSGARPTGVADTVESGEGLGLVVDRREIWVGHWLAGNIPGWTAQSLTSALYQSRYLSNEGRLYFNSPDDLVPAASNRKEDVYEYEPSGVGSCESATGGCLSLISGGGSDRESAFLEATPDGSDVFFLTEAQLLPQDTDTAFDIYDARECTQSDPCLSPPPAKEAPCAQTETCRPAEAAQQIPSGPAGTATASGPGNIGTSSMTPAPSSAQHGVDAKKAAKPLTRAQKLARALAECRKHHARSKPRRQSCERLARKRYRPAQKAANKKPPKKAAARQRHGGSRRSGGR